MEGGNEGGRDEASPELGLGGRGEMRGVEPGFGSGGADGHGHRKLCSWTPRCSWPYCGGCSRVCTSTCSRWASGPCSTCPSGSCASLPAPCPSPRCCVSGTPFSVRVSGGRQAGGGGAGREPWGARDAHGMSQTAVLPHPSLPVLAPGLDAAGCRGVLRVMAPCWPWGNSPALGHTPTV